MTPTTSVTSDPEFVNAIYTHAQSPDVCFATLPAATAVPWEVSMAFRAGTTRVGKATTTLW